MKSDCFTLLESYFVPEYRHRLIPLIKSVDRDEDFQQNMREQLTDLTNEDNGLDLILEKDWESFRGLIRTYSRNLLLRLRAYKITEEDSQ
jgi:hypothetical protein